MWRVKNELLLVNDANPLEALDGARRLVQGLAEMIEHRQRLVVEVQHQRLRFKEVATGL